MKTDRPLHPWLFALFPVLAVYTQNIHEVRFSDLTRPVLFVLLLALILFLLLRLLLRDARAGVLVSLFFVASFAYTPVTALLTRLLVSADLGRWAMDKIFFPLWGLGALWAVMSVVRTRRDLRSLNRILNTASALLVLFTAIQVGTAAARRPGPSPAGLTSGRTEAEMNVRLVPPPDPPDVYYLVFDRYASASTLRDFYGFDNREFVDFLRGEAFSVPDTARANYPLTHLSLASSLSMAYLGDHYVSEIRYRPLMQESEVARIFRNAGYRYIQIGSWYEPTRWSPLADENLNYSLLLSEFSKALLRTTPYHLFLLRHELQRQGVYALRALENMPRSKGPKFVFAHLLITHPPYQYGADGSFLSAAEMSKWTEEEIYLNQIRFVNSRLKRILHDLIAESKTPPIIVLQADEGPLLLSERKQALTREEKLRLRAGILFALYLPGPGAPPDPGMTPVNTFRYIFDRYFGTHLGRLPDRVYFWPEANAAGAPRRIDQPFPFVDITGVVSRTAPPPSDPALPSFSAR